MNIEEKQEHLDNWQIEHDWKFNPKIALENAMKQQQHPKYSTIHLPQDALDCYEPEVFTENGKVSRESYVAWKITNGESPYPEHHNINSTKENKMAFLTEEQFEQNVEETEMEKTQMEDRANAKSTIEHGYHQKDMPLDSEVYDQVMHKFLDIINLLAPEDDQTLAYSRIELPKQFMRMAEYLADKTKAINWKAGALNRAIKANRGDEISDNNVTNATNALFDLQRQEQNYKKHYLNPMREVYDLVCDEPYSKLSSSKANQTVNSYANAKAQEALNGINYKFNK